jgi:hypothetical protein
MSFTKGFRHRLFVSRKLVLIVLLILSLTVIVGTASFTQAGPAGGGGYCPGC